MTKKRDPKNGRPSPTPGEGEELQPELRPGSFAYRVGSSSKPTGQAIPPPMERRARRRGPKLPPLLGRQLFSPSQWTLVGEILRLAPREMDIVQGMFDDEKESAIAFHLGIKFRTLHTRVERLYRKLEVESRGEVLLRVFQVWQDITIGDEARLESGAREAGSSGGVC